jgi:YD repeat-containing protein
MSARSLLLRRPLTQLTRATVCRILGVTRSAVVHYQKTGRLTSVVDADGIHRFNREEVDALAATRRARRLQTVSGDVAADVFRLFEAGYSPAEVVIELAQPTEIVRALWEDYKAFESQRPSALHRKPGRPKASAAGPLPPHRSPPQRSALSLLPSPEAASAPNVSAWSRDFDAQQEKRRIRRLGNRP